MLDLIMEVISVVMDSSGVIFDAAFIAAPEEPVMAELPELPMTAAGADDPASLRILDQ